MLLPLIPGLLEKLQADPDAELTGDGSYVLDVYECPANTAYDSPATFELLISDANIEVLAAAELLFSDELDGYYMGKRLEDAAQIRAMLADYVASDLPKA